MYTLLAGGENKSGSKIPVLEDFFFFFFFPKQNEILNPEPDQKRAL